MIVRPLDEVLKEHPEFGDILGWKADQYGGMENPKFGKLTHVAVCKDDGTPIFDQYTITETPGAIIVPYDDNEGVVRVGLVTQHRFVPDKEFYELPRGFGKENETALATAYRELFEETGLLAVNSKIEVIGRENPNTAFYVTDDPIVAIQIKDLDAMRGFKTDSNDLEKITAATPFKYSEIVELANQGKFDCGLSGNALFRFGMYKPEFHKS